MVDWSLLAQQNDGAAVVGLGMGLICMLAFGLLLSIFWVWALIDAIRNPRLSSNQRLIWVIVILLTQILGAIIYLLIGREGDQSGSG
ncbi:PLD nuclease N-terminal domain-containing protein [Blastopirellula sp. JC732]|uniref:PLD nuclease N-terminal domain-containing protein n=1 Tax=Blastopirellula sediminis TaxID=2894196 RepID=A0A9X1SEX5_9BACT|nr:PLD nuclease N-terminal domain-containing protein [Blastopirellula sediminis]MCC9608833.1 PLD nuclease N-terminal domain-containing protein [Blastopirellula sediminis]MCC9628390.1 PLD nuclease N-terminal domain-containing protein [Blastopirellula sediminis]